jgi:hypothetical protein
MLSMQPTWVGLVVKVWDLGVCSSQGLKFESSCCDFLYWVSPCRAKLLVQLNNLVFLAVLSKEILCIFSPFILSLTHLICLFLAIYFFCFCPFFSGGWILLPRSNGKDHPNNLCSKERPHIY